MTSHPSPGRPGAERLSRLRRDAGGNYALILALVLPMLIPAVGIGIDTMRAMTLKQDLQHSIDAAAQTMTQKLNLCLDGKRTQSGGKGLVDDVDTGCLNDAVFTGGLKASAQTLLTNNFTQRGYVVPPRIDGEVTINQLTGDMQMRGSVTYKCFFMKMIDPNGCLVTVGSGDALKNAFAQSKPLKIIVPTNLFDIWAEEPNQPNPPVVITATDGWKPYSFATGPNLPAGLALSQVNDTTAQIQGRPTDTPCDTPNCLPQTMPPVAVSVMDSGDTNRANMNRQTDVDYVRFRMIHVLKISQIQGITGEDGRRDQSTGTDVRPNVFTYGAEVTVSGGLGPFTFACTGLPTGLPNKPFTCDAGTGRISGQPLLNVGMQSQSGTYRVTVTDARGKTASAQMNYTYRLPGFTAYGGAVSGTFGKDFTAANAFGADGGYGWVRAQCFNLPPGVYCGGEGYDGSAGRWGYYEGFVQGRPAEGSPETGVITVRLWDAAGRSIDVGVTYTWRRPTIDDFDSYDCGDGISTIGTVQSVYNSVHCKFGCGFARQISVTCGASTDASGYNPNTFAAAAWNAQGPQYGKNYQQRYLSKPEMSALVDWANGMCNRMYSELVAVSDGRQGNTCQGSVTMTDTTNYGRLNSGPPPPPPAYCWMIQSQDGWNQNRYTVRACQDQSGNIYMGSIN